MDGEYEFLIGHWVKICYTLLKDGEEKKGIMTGYVPNIKDLGGGIEKVFVIEDNGLVNWVTVGNKNLIKHNITILDWDPNSPLKKKEINRFENLDFEE